jgi:hypothetical protein
MFSCSERRPMPRAYKGPSLSKVAAWIASIGRVLATTSTSRSQAASFGVLGHDLLCSLERSGGCVSVPPLGPHHRPCVSRRHCGPAPTAPRGLPPADAQDDRATERHGQARHRQPDRPATGASTAQESRCFLVQMRRALWHALRQATLRQAQSNPAVCLIFTLVWRQIGYQRASGFGDGSRFH